jgi:hypothetical protein
VQERKSLIEPLLNHDDLALHVITWCVPIFVALFTLLYKGIWKAINTNDTDAHERMDAIEADQKMYQRDLDRLLGEHAVRHPVDWDGVERRSNPNRPTHPNYRKKGEAHGRQSEVPGRSSFLDGDEGSEGLGC